MLFGFYLAHTIITKHTREYDLFRELDREGGGAGKEDAETSFLFKEEEDLDAASCWSRVLHYVCVGREACIATPEAVLVIATVAFILELLAVGVWQPNGVPLPALAMFDNSHEQWVFGLAALALVVLFGTLEATLYVYQLAVTDGIEQKYAALMFLLTGGVYGGTGFLLYSTTSSWIVLASFVCAPFAFTSGSAAYTTWLFRGFSATEPHVRQTPNPNPNWSLMCDRPTQTIHHTRQ